MQIGKPCDATRGSPYVSCYSDAYLPLLRREGDSLLFFMASRVKLIHGLLAPLRPTTTYVHGSVSLPRFHSPLCSKEHVELIPSDYNTCTGINECSSGLAMPSRSTTLTTSSSRIANRRPSGLRSNSNR